MLPLSTHCAFSASIPPLLFRSRRARTRKCRYGFAVKAVVKGLSPSDEPVFPRRGLVVLGISSVVFPSFGYTAVAAAAAEEGLRVESQVDEINSYSYSYPVELPSKKLVFKWVESRKPERYSSAAPLSRKFVWPGHCPGNIGIFSNENAADARLRIVSERVDFLDNLIISVSVGPPNSQIIKSKEKGKWTAKEVADSVLADKSALRVTSSQRLAESSLIDAHSSDINGEPYWYYEYLVRKSPTKLAQESNLYRHYVASTAERDGYLYTLNASTLGKQWLKMGPILEKTVASFRLLPPTDNYVPPYKDPWRFW